MLTVALAVGLAAAGPVAQAQTQGREAQLTSEQLEILNSLPPDQRDALIDQLLGSGARGAMRTEDQPQFPQTIFPRDPNAEELESEGPFAEPRFHANDTLLLLLQIREYKDSDPQRPPVAPPVTPAQGAAQGAAPATPSSRAAEKIIRTPEEIEELEKLRDRIQNRNPYRLDRLGRFEVPELGSIALAGLTEMQAEQRLSVAPQLKEFRVDIVRLPLERLGEEALKPFGYDLFAGIPTTFAPATDVPVPAEYVVGPGDQIRVQLYGDVNESYLLTVGRDGRIDFPELGPVEVAGQTFTQVRQDLEGRVSRQMIGTVASVSMGETRSIRVFVLGEAYRPGSYTVSGLSTITNALFVSGGVKEIGSLRNIQLKRRGQVVSRLDLYDLLLRGDTTDDSRLLPGDVIFIPPVGKTAAVTGEVRRPAIYEIAGETSPRQMIELAGGLTAEADPSFVRIERTNEQRQRVTTDVDLAPGVPAVALASGDVLRVLPIRATLENSVLVQGHVHRPGAFQYRPGMRISDVIGSLDELKPRADMHYVLVRRELPPDRHRDRPFGGSRPRACGSRHRA